ncbi:GTP-binding protein [Bradyrhizobium sp. vgs-9]|uniref:GTP-binding protein n=1 Tax=Bradyrhizobium sp. vgs-9 TaxID=208389 RepID=UPI0035D41C1B
MKYLNIGILAHVDAGKTSTTERILFDSGVLQQLGSVDTGTTQTDSLEQEKRRGITIKSAVTAFSIGDVRVNLVDTPGHPDFIAEIERVLDVLDAAVLVVSSVEGVQAQTRVLFRALSRKKLPFIIFVNKIDRVGARCEKLVEEIRGRLTPVAIPLGTVTNIGQRNAAYVPYLTFPPRELTSLIEILAENDADILAQFVSDGEMVDQLLLRRSFIRQISEGLVYPVIFGSAITGAGIAELLSAIADFLPAKEPDNGAAPHGTVFKIERAPAGEKIAYVRMFEGALRTRERAPVGGKEQRITAVEVFEDGRSILRTQVSAGQIAKVWGLALAQIGDAVGTPRAVMRNTYFSPPLLETAVRPRNPKDRGRLYTALAQLAEQDPLIGLRQDDNAGLLFLSLYGEVQKEVIQESLASDFHVQAEFSESRIIHVERVIGVGEARDEAPEPFIATIGLRIEPREPGSGNVFAYEINTGTLPAAFCRAVEEAAMDTLEQGLYGWRVIDCKVTMTDSIRHRDWANSTAADHRKLAPLVVMDALKRAGTTVCEPIQLFHLECPSDTVGTVIAEVVLLRGIPKDPTTQGKVSTVEGTIPAGNVQKLQQLLPSLTHGEGFVETQFSHYDFLIGQFPTRDRTDKNPLNRNDYLRQVK